MREAARQLQQSAFPLLPPRAPKLLSRGTRMVNGRRELGSRPPWIASSVARAAALACAGPASPAPSRGRERPRRLQLRAPRREQRQHVPGRGGGWGRCSAPPRRSPPPELGCAGRPRLSRGRVAAGAAAQTGRRAVREGAAPGAGPPPESRSSLEARRVETPLARGRVSVRTARGSC